MGILMLCAELMVVETAVVTLRVAAAAGFDGNCDQDGMRQKCRVCVMLRSERRPSPPGGAVGVRPLYLNPAASRRPRAILMNCTKVPLCDRLFAAALTLRPGNDAAYAAGFVADEK
jgi:hypothetical protein